MVATLRLIVHADDLGISEQVNNGILKAHQEGILTSTSIMATGAAFEHAVTTCRSVPNLDVGIHLTLVEEQPLLEKELIPSLVDSEGRFFGHATMFTQRYFLRKIRIAEVVHELDAQIRKVLDSGLAISHLDSHQHVHMLPEIWRAVVELATKYHIPAVRLARERLRLYMLRESSAAARVGPLLILNLLAGNCQGKKIRTTDNFVGFYFGGKMTKKNMKTVIKNLPASGTCELMCHPGLLGSDERYGHWYYNWGAELDALIDPEVQGLLRSKGVELISYRDLG